MERPQTAGAVIAAQLTSLAPDKGGPPPTTSRLVQQGNLQLVEQFLSERVRVQPAPGQDPVVQAELYTACFWGFADTVATLLQQGASTSARPCRAIEQSVGAAGCALAPALPSCRSRCIVLFYFRTRRARRELAQRRDPLDPVARSSVPGARQGRHGASAGWGGSTCAGRKR